jgi:hypothetical protein
LHGFPEYILPEIVPVLRVHMRSLGPWWYKSGTGQPRDGRFDLRDPLGTCYVGEDAYGPFLEVFQDWINIATPIPYPEVQKRVMSTLHLPTALTIADCIAAKALGFGVAAGIHTSKDRMLTLAWAEAFSRHGFAGVRYYACNDPSMGQISMALFGPAGARSWPVAATHSLTAAFLAEIERRFSVKIG